LRLSIPSSFLSSRYCCSIGQWPGSSVTISCTDAVASRLSSRDRASWSASARGSHVDIPDAPRFSCYRPASRHPPAPAAKRARLLGRTAPEDDATSTLPPDSRHCGISKSWAGELQSGRRRIISHRVGGFRCQHRPTGIHIPFGVFQSGAVDRLRFAARGLRSVSGAPRPCSSGTASPSRAPWPSVIRRATFADIRTLGAAYVEAKRNNGPPPSSRRALYRLRASAFRPFTGADEALAAPYRHGNRPRRARRGWPATS